VTLGAARRKVASLVAKLSSWNRGFLKSRGLAIVIAFYVIQRRICSGDIYPSLVEGGIFNVLPLIS
jgi:hypothetical protein